MIITYSPWLYSEWMPVAAAFLVLVLRLLWLGTCSLNRRFRLLRAIHSVSIAWPSPRYPDPVQLEFNPPLAPSVLGRRVPNYAVDSCP